MSRRRCIPVFQHFFRFRGQRRYRCDSRHRKPGCRDRGSQAGIRRRPRCGVCSSHLSLGAHLPTFKLRTKHEHRQSSVSPIPRSNVLAGAVSGCTMIRSIRWITLSASSPFCRGCATLPQPRSRIAFAADTRAAGVASFERMMPTRILIAVLVWLRATDRISVIVLALLTTLPISRRRSGRRAPAQSDRQSRHSP